MNVYRDAPPVAIRRTRSTLVAALFIAGASLGTLHGWQASTYQTATVSERGARPLGSYRIGDLETISETTGGLTLSIPLASLPKGRGGKDFQLNMVYNSALYDTYVDYSTSSNNGIGPGSGSPLPTAKMIESPSGGWQYAFGYGLEQEWRTTSGGCSAETAKSVKLRLRMPDGGSKLLRLGGYLSGSSRYGGTPEFQDISGDGFYEYTSDGFRTACSGAPSPLVGDLAYYTDDGSFIRVVISATGVQAGPLSWIVYLPDGSQDFGFGASTTRIFDRNGNYIRVIRITENGLPVTKFVDEISGRQIELRQETGTSQDLVSYQGANAENVTVVISRSSVNVGPRTYTCNWEFASCTSWFNHRTVNQIQRIAPNSAGVLETFSFLYSACTYCGGELNSVTLPSGARYEYSYAFDGWSSWPSMTYLNPVAQKRAIYSEVADGQSTSITDTTDYCFDGRGNSCGSGAVGKSSIVGPDGGRTTNFYSANPSALVFKVERPDGSVVERQWASNRPYFAPSQAFSNPYVRLEVNSIPNAAGTPSRAGSRRTSMDRNGNQTLVEEFGWVNYSPTLGSVVPITALPAGAESLLLRSSSADYFYSPGPATNGAVPDSATAYWYPSAPRQLRAASTRVVRDGSGSVKAYAAFEYDASTAPPQRGNPTKEKQWDSVKGSNQLANIVTTERIFDLFGNLLTEKDPNGNITRFEYNSNLTSLIARYVADGQAVVRTTTFEYDFSTGLPTVIRDVENDTKTVFQYDVRGRVQLIREAADSGATERRTRTAYNDPARRITEFRDLNSTGDEKRVTVRLYDPLYRIRLEQAIENIAVENASLETSGIKRQFRYRYDNTGSYRLVSNPFRSAQSNQAAAETTMGWTREYFDRAGRPRRTDFYSGIGLPPPWSGPLASTGAVRTDYDGETTTTFDEADKVRSVRSDALGRVDRVVEGGLYTTLYLSDALDNLVQVDQGVQSRTFTYSSLSRLLSATQPEMTGPLRYTYDNNGNLTQKEDARGVFTAWTPYDGLNRPTSKSYTDGTPSVTYGYDSGTNAKGRLTSVAFSVSSSSTGGFDKLGRAGNSSQTTNGVTYSFAYNYDLADSLRGLTLPTGRVVTYGVDTAGRLSTVSGTLGGQPKTYSSQMVYAPNGEARQWALGNGVWQTVAFNARQQVSNLSVGISAGSSSLLALAFGWFNNGNLNSQTISVPGFSQVQTYEFDGLNRITAAMEATGSVWKQAFQFDQYGNRWQNQTLGLPLDPLTPVTQNHFVASTNRLVQPPAPALPIYDAAGNQLVVNPNTLTYDAENRQKSARMQVVNDVFERFYTYDCEGRRVRRVEKLNANVVRESTFVYDAFGRLGVEYGGTPAQAGTRFLTTDYLGSTRLVTSETGAVVGRRDLTPFGEVIPAGTGGRGGEFSAPTGTSLLLTGKERDAETGLDYFDARYLSGAQGRFTSNDPLDGWSGDPQSWNKYAYARNNPLLYTDPSGMRYTICDTSGACHEDYSDADFDKNLDATSRNGVTFDNNRNKIGTYQRTSFDDFSPMGNMFFGDMSNRRDASNQMIAATAAGSAVVGAAAGAAVASGTVVAVVDGVAYNAQQLAALGPVVLARFVAAGKISTDVFQKLTAQGSVVANQSYLRLFAQSNNTTISQGWLNNNNYLRVGEGFAPGGPVF